MKDMQVGNSSKGPEFEINFIILRVLGFGVAIGSPANEDMTNMRLKYI